LLRPGDVMALAESRIPDLVPFWPGLMLSIHGIVVAVWFFGVPRVFEGDLTAGVFDSFVLYLTMFTQPIEVIGQMARMINRATSSAHRVFEIIDTEPSAVTSTQGEKVEALSGHVEFKNVSFSYDGVRKVIKNMSFEAKPGEMIGLVGPSGGGKSTTTSLLARFYDVNRGQILVDGRPLTDLDVGSFRSKIGIVLQDPYLFHGTVLENIRYARPEASLQEVMEAARVANAHDFICRLPYGYETVVGERGHTLSGGERQRISIARAVLRDPQLLILDEATSAVDTETEKKIQDALDRLIEGRTVFAIAHRLSTLKSADRILVIKEGEIVENGTHGELMKLEEGIYKNLVDLQNEFARV
ncbi:MAG: ABC transporter ATP-binding protein, partial [Pseudomonadota bacterium]